jgi:lactate racemase
MKIFFPYGRDSLTIQAPDSAHVYHSLHAAALDDPSAAVVESLSRPIGTCSLAALLKEKHPASVAVVIADITRPIPYKSFLPAVLREIESCGVSPAAIRMIIATGMHRGSTKAEREEMIGDIATTYTVFDHHSNVSDELVRLAQKSWSGNPVSINRYFVESDFRIITGLIEPHFMAGFSGGRKAVCPGLADINTIRNLHGISFLAMPQATNGVLDGNPCHEEALSVARSAGVDFAVNVALDASRKITGVFSGELDASHRAGCAFVRRISCPAVCGKADVAVVSGGGYPIDATFYQCVKGMVTALPMLAPGATVVSMGSCTEGIGSETYTSLMQRYTGRWREFLSDAAQESFFVKDQWQFQMQTRVLAATGEQRLVFLTDGLTQKQLASLSVNGVAAQKGRVQEKLQAIIDRYVSEGKSFAILPEGPYCTPLEESSR